MARRLGDRRNVSSPSDRGRARAPRDRAHVTARVRVRSDRRQAGDHRKGSRLLTTQNGAACARNGYVHQPRVEKRRRPADDVFGRTRSPQPFRACPSTASVSRPSRDASDESDDARCRPWDVTKKYRNRNFPGTRGCLFGTRMDLKTKSNPSRRCALTATRRNGETWGLAFSSAHFLRSKK